MIEVIWNHTCVDDIANYSTEHDEIGLMLYMFISVMLRIFRMRMSLVVLA